MSFERVHPAAPDPYLGDRAATSSVVRPPLDGWSVASLVAAVTGLTPLGLVAAVVGLARTAGGRRRGRGLAVAAVVVSSVVGVLQVVAVTVLVSVWPEVRAGFEDAREDAREDAGTVWVEPPVGAQTAPPDGTATAPSVVGEVAADALTVGTCFVDPEGDVFYDVETVACDRPHDGEVVALVELEDRLWPGDDPVLDEGYDACLVELTDLLLEAGLDGGHLDPWVFTPTRESWVLFDDRAATCVVYSADGEPLTAPALG